MDRQPVVAGQFYPGNWSALQAQVDDYLQGEAEPDKTFLVMVPHAGYVFSGGVAGKTIARANLSRKIILLGPNHSGRGAKMAVWDKGNWIMPGFEAPVDSGLADIVMQVAGFTTDYAAHQQEHSLEAILPFLKVSLDKFSMVPVAVAESDPGLLVKAGKSLGQAIKNKGEDVSVVVSSDMSHYVSQDQARENDQLAIDRVLALDPEGLYRTVAENRISMCGMLPMVLGLACVRELGATKGRLVGYATSGDVNNDYSKVVGYAGIIIS
ncbi:MAG: AmmeMemoRadiSam system protein B [Desulfonatronovibrio sp.]